MKTGICEWCIPVDKTAGRFEWATKAGLTGIQMDLENAGGHESDILELANEWQLTIPTLGVNATCNHSMCSTQGDAIIQKAFEQAIETALKLGCSKLQIPSFCESFIRTQDDLDRTVEYFRTLCRISEGTDLIIGSENALTADQQFELLDRVACDRLKMYFDTRNLFSMQGYSSAEILKQIYPHLCEVHLKDGIGDGPSCELGSGNSGFHDCINILHENHYNGWYILENDYTSIEQCQNDIEITQASLKLNT